MNEKFKTEAIARLRAQREEVENLPESVGLIHGKYWAENTATYTQLRRLAIWWEKFHAPSAGSRVTLAYDAAEAISPEIGRYGHSTAAEELFLKGKTVAPDGIPNSYVADFATAAMRVFSEVESVS